MHDIFYIGRKSRPDAGTRDDFLYLDSPGVGEFHCALVRGCDAFPHPVIIDFSSVGMLHNTKSIETQSALPLGNASTAASDPGIEIVPRSESGTTRPRWARLQNGDRIQLISSTKNLIYKIHLIPKTGSP